MPKVFIETNFSFSKIAKEFDSLEVKFRKNTNQAMAKAAKQKIKSGSLRPLKPTARSKKEFAKYGKTPLYKKRNLYNSIKGDSEGLHMLEYGEWHNNGGQAHQRPQRQFIEFTKKQEKEASKQIVDGINRLLKK